MRLLLVAFSVPHRTTPHSRDAGWHRTSGLTLAVPEDLRKSFVPCPGRPNFVFPRGSSMHHRQEGEFGTGARTTEMLSVPPPLFASATKMSQALWASLVSTTTR